MTSEAPAPNLKRIPELDGLRAFAVVAVVIFHMSDYAGSLPRLPYGIADVITCLGPSAVNVFFVISGFIITTLLMREQRTTGNVSLGNFYLRRFFRIVPPFAIFLLALVLVRAAGAIVISNHNLLCGALFLGDAGLFEDHGWFVAHTWSLAIEEQFYLVLPPLLCLVFRFDMRAVLIALCASYGFSVISGKLAQELARYVHPQFFRLGELHRFRYIIVGVALATHGTLILRLLKDRSRIWPLVFAAAILAIQLLKMPPVLVSLGLAAVEPVLCALFVMWFMQNPSRCGFLRWPIIQWFGACSYSIYLWQQLFTGASDCYDGWTIAQKPWSVLLILACAAGSFYLIERPSIRLGRLLTKPRRVTPETVPAVAGSAPDMALP